MRPFTPDFTDPAGVTPFLPRMLYNRAPGELSVMNFNVEEAFASPDWQSIIQGRYNTPAGYARAAVKIFGLYQLYKLGQGTEKNVYRRALADAEAPPEITSVELYYNRGIGERYIITAIDDFMVTSVYVKVYNSSGDLVESGPAAIKGDELKWEYETSANHGTWTGGTVVVFARDFAGNMDIQGYNTENPYTLTS